MTLDPAYEYAVGLAYRKQRPTMQQEIRSPPVPQEPKLVDVKPASQ